MGLPIKYIFNSEELEQYLEASFQRNYCSLKTKQTAHICCYFPKSLLVKTRGWSCEKYELALCRAGFTKETYNLKWIAFLKEHDLELAKSLFKCCEG